MPRPREKAASVPPLRLLPRSLVGVAAGAVVLAGCSGGSPSDARTVQIFDPTQRQPAPVIEGPSLTGDVINLRNFAGHVVVLNFWGSWCGPCRAEQAKLNEVYAAEHPHGVDFLGINIRDDDAAATSFLRNNRVRYPSIVDEPDATALQFDPRLPENPPITVVVDRAGRVAAKILGPASTGVLRPLVQQLAAESGT